MCKYIIRGCMAFLALAIVGCSPLTPLGRVAMNNDLEGVRQLLAGGEDVNKKVVGQAPLNEAVYGNSSPEVVRLLIERGANINYSCNGDGWTTDCGTPLHLAVHKNNAQLIRVLLDYGADPSLKNCGLRKQTPLQLAQDKGASPEIIDMLKEAETRQATQIYAKPQTPRPTGQLAPAVAQTSVESDVDTLPQFSVGKNQRAYAVVVGVERYRQKLPPADFASHDADTVSKYLTGALGYLEENVITLTNEQASLGDFVKYFEKWLPNNVEPGDSVFVYYSGHGAPNPTTGDAYLVPYDGDPSFVEETGYSLKRMYAALDKLPALKVVVALDSCFSGAGGRSVLAKGARPIVIQTKEPLLTSKNLSVFSASSGDQISSTYNEKGHGLFTYFLLKGIKDEDVVSQDGSLRLDDLYAYLKPQVERVARKQYNNEQTPQLFLPKK